MLTLHSSRLRVSTQNTYNDRGYRARECMREREGYMRLEMETGPGHANTKCIPHYRIGILS